MKPHAFVAMPFGVKPGVDGVPIDFNRIYEQLLAPALQDAGCEVFRADAEQRAGDIRADMFQELLVADLVLADLTIDNPNVWYELGVRHALRARGVVLVQGPRPNQPFDLYTDRKVNYGLQGGLPDPATLQRDREAIATMARETLATSTRRKVSPVYALLPHLEQPEWRRLLMDRHNEFGAAYAQWKGRMDVARLRRRAGDILVLADETPTRALALDARRDAASALLRLSQNAHEAGSAPSHLSQHRYALEQVDAALAMEPDDRLALTQRVVCLSRIPGRREEAEQAAQQLLSRSPNDPEAMALAGRIAKERWLSRWRDSNADPARLREQAAAETAALESAIALYHRAFVVDPSHYYSGINSLLLHTLLRELGGAVPVAVAESLAGGVRWGILSALARDPGDYWAKASLAEWCLLLDAQPAVEREYRAATAAASGEWFALDAMRETLRLLSVLRFRPSETAAALAIVEREIARASLPFVPRQVVLGAGHMVDAPSRSVPRFPSTMVGKATAAIDHALDALGVGEGDLAVTIGAAGGDLVFAEACLARGARVHLHLPQSEPAFVEDSIMRCDDASTWRDRFYAVKARLKDPIRVMTDDLGPPPRGANLYERCNRWLLYTALAWGEDRLRFVCLWDGAGGDGPGGTRHMLEEVKRHSGRVHWIDTRTL